MVQDGKNPTDDASTRFDRMIRSLKVTPEQAGRMRKLRAMSGPISVRLLPGDRLRSGDGGRLGENPWMEEALHDLPPVVRAKLSQIESRVLEWVEKSDANAAAFAQDPLGALKKAVPDLDDTTIASLRDIRSRRSGKPSDPGVNFTKTTLKADRKTRG